MHFTRPNVPFLFALTLVSAALLLAIMAAPSFARQRQNPDQLPTAANPFPSRPGQPNAPNFGTNQIPLPDFAESNPGPMLQENQKQMKQDIQQLYDMVQQLKQQSDKTNSAQVLSLDLVQKTKKIQDLAKKIGKLAAGS